MTVRVKAEKEGEDDFCIDRPNKGRRKILCLRRLIFFFWKTRRIQDEKETSIPGTGSK